MNGIEKITQRITADAQAEIDRVLGAAREEAARITARMTAEADAVAAELAAKNEKSAAEHEERLVSAAQMEARKVQLAAKQEQLAAVNARLVGYDEAREMDAYLSAGEQLSAGLMAMAIGALGAPAVSLTGWQAGLMTDHVHGNARVLGLKSDRIQKELKKGNIVVVAGFQGIDQEGDITTLGRGGSDTTAVALAAFLKADLCQIFTDVDGVYDRDPRHFPDATRFGRLSYEKMLRLIENGAQVLHDRSVELAREHGIRIEVLSSFTGAPGTIVEP